MIRFKNYRPNYNNGLNHLLYLLNSFIFGNLRKKNDKTYLYPI